jgi:dTDP-4-dehydrorhamnose reductase
MRILVTGSNGLLGRKLSDLIGLNTSHELIRTARSPESETGLPGVYCPMDITDHAAVNNALRQTSPDVIIHAAAMTQVDDCETRKDDCWKNNVTATEYLLNAASGIGAHFIYISTDFIFDGSHGPLDENAEPAPVNFYGESKLAAEKLVMQYPGPWAILRTVLVFGITPGAVRNNIVTWVKGNLESGKKIKVVCDQWRTPTLAEDLAMGCLLTAEHRAQGVFNVSGKELLTPYDMAMQVADFFGLDQSLIEKTDGTAFRQTAQRPAKTGFIIEKAEKAWGYKPHTFIQGLEVIAGQLKKNI